MGGTLIFFFFTTWLTSVIDDSVILGLLVKRAYRVDLLFRYSIK